MMFPTRTALIAFALVATMSGCAKKAVVAEEPVTPPAVEKPAEEATTTPVDASGVSGTDLAGGSTAGAGGADYGDAAGAAGGSAGGGLAADGFESDPANYAGDTRTRVIYFGFDRAEIPAAAYATLKAHARHLAANPGAMLRLEGHADERGTPEYNVALAERRGKTVQQFLVLNGARAGQLEVISYGEEKPAVLGTDELSWAKNRRVEVAYSAGQP